jgi:hypothetical protein
MRTETRTIYKISELPTERAKERARDWWRYTAELVWMDESRESIQAFCKHFGVTLKTWSVGPYAPFDFSTNAEQSHFRGVRLRDFDRDHMPTGYCLDCTLWMTFYDRFKATGDAKQAFNDALREGFKDWRNDMESQMEDDYIDEAMEANGYEFTEEGLPA